MHSEVRSYKDVSHSTQKPTNHSGDLIKTLIHLGHNFESPTGFAGA